MNILLDYFTFSIILINKNRNGEKSPYLKDYILILHYKISSDNMYLK